MGMFYVPTQEEIEADDNHMRESLAKFLGRRVDEFQITRWETECIPFQRPYTADIYYTTIERRDFFLQVSLPHLQDGEIIPIKHKELKSTFDVKPKSIFWRLGDDDL